MDENVSKARNYTFTINNYSESDLQGFEDLASALTKHHYICYGFEVAPSTGTKHIQGYIQLDSAQRYSFLHNYFDFKKDNETLKFHVEIANGTPEQNKVYCQKDGDFYEFGVATAQGARTDLKEIKEKIKENPKNLHQIIDEHGNNYQQSESPRPHGTGYHCDLRSLVKECHSLTSIFCSLIGNIASDDISGHSHC